MTVTTALGRSTRYETEKDSSGAWQRVITSPDGTQRTAMEKTDGSTVVAAADGTVVTRSARPDPRFGMQAPLHDVEIRLPSGLTATATTRQTYTPSANNDLSRPQALETTKEYNGRPYKSTWQAADRSLVSVSPEGRESTVYLDEKGRVTKKITPGLAAVNYSYDGRGRLVSISEGSGEALRTSQLTYGADSGYLSGVTDALEGVVSFVHDPVGRTVRQVLPDTREISFGYDLDGNLDELTPPGRPVHGFEHSPIGQTTEYAPPLLPAVSQPQTEYEYNLDKQLTEIRRPDGRVIGFNYDVVSGRLEGLAVDGQPAVSYSYSETDGKLQTVTTAGGVSLSYTYDGALTLSETLSSMAVNGVVSQVYNNDLRIEKFTVESNNVTHAIDYAYDDDGLLTQAGTVTLNRDALNGLLRGTVLNDGDNRFTIARDYNLFGETASVTAAYNETDLYGAVYTRDKLGRIETKTETVAGVSTVYEYGYDVAGRLETVTENGVETHRYGYDANSNRTHLNNQPVGVYDDQDRLLGYAGNTYAYTANGELTTKTSSAGVMQYGYDVFGNLKTVNLPDGRVIEYMVDGRDRRIGKQVNGALVQAFLYQGSLNPVAELDADGNLVSLFVYASKGHVPDYLVKAGRVYRVVSDYLGSVRLVVDMAGGAVVQRLDYDAFGRVVFDSNPGFQPFGFAGGIYDPDTGLVRFGARDYDAETGRWTAKDPILFAGGDSNLYGYVLADPVNWVDPTGLVLYVDAANEGPLGNLLQGSETARQQYNILHNAKDNWYITESNYDPSVGPITNTATGEMSIDPDDVQCKYITCSDGTSERVSPERAIAHEMTHAAVYQNLKNNFGGLGANLLLNLNLYPEALIIDAENKIMQEMGSNAKTRNRGGHTLRNGPCP